MENRFDGWPNALESNQFLEAKGWLKEFFFPLVRREEHRLMADERSGLFLGTKMLSLSYGESATWMENAMQNLGGKVLSKVGIVRRLCDDVQAGNCSEVARYLNCYPSNVIIVSGYEIAMQVINASNVPVINACLIRSILAMCPRGDSSTSLLVRRISIASAMLQSVLCK